MLHAVFSPRGTEGNATVSQQTRTRLHIRKTCGADSRILGRPIMRSVTNGIEGRSAGGISLSPSGCLVGFNGLPRAVPWAVIVMHLRREGRRFLAKGSAT